MRKRGIHYIIAIIIMVICMLSDDKYLEIIKEDTMKRPMQSHSEESKSDKDQKKSSKSSMTVAIDLRYVMDSL